MAGNVAIERAKLRTQCTKIYVAIDRSQQMICRNPVIQAEILKHRGRL